MVLSVRWPWQLFKEKIRIGVMEFKHWSAGAMAYWSDEVFRNWSFGVLA
jgi:hypothetical protein